MKIENRVKKPYSEKVFNELCALFILAYCGSIDLYTFELITKKSIRTYNRYLDELHKVGLMPKVVFRNKIEKNEIDPKLLFSDPKKQNRKEKMCFTYTRINSLFVYDRYEYLIKYAKRRHNYSNRLYRLGILLYNNFGYGEEDVEFSDVEEIQKVVSKRTYQRDVKLVRDVLVKMADF